MIFFTDINTNVSNYCMLNIKRYNSKKKETKKVIFVDPSVYELKNNTEYSKIDLLHNLSAGNLKKNEYISIDYPCDMNLKNAELFINKSIANNLKYADNPKYICTLQYKFQDFKDFKFRFDELSHIFLNKNKILGLGNLCRIMYPNTYTNDIFSYILRFRKQIKSIHIYGLALRLIRKYIPILEGNNIKVSVDSTKWTRACTKVLKLKYGLNCKNSNRNEFFLEYMKLIKKSGIKVKY